LGIIAIDAVISLGLTGCDKDDEGAGNDDAPTVSSVTVSLGANVEKGGIRQFTAKVEGLPGQ
jgi:hypothetical protein